MNDKTLDLVKYRNLERVMRAEYETYKKEVLKDPKDWQFGELYIKYELCEFINYILEDYQEEIDKERLEWLCAKKAPLQYFYDIYSDRDDGLYDDLADLLGYNIKWEKDHND